MPNIIDSHDMGLRTVLQSRRPKVNAYSTPIQGRNDAHYEATNIEALIQANSNCVIFGDFNATHSAWNCSKNSPRGIRLKDYTDDNNLEIAFPNSPTRARKLYQQTLNPLHKTEAYRLSHTTGPTTKVKSSIKTDSQLLYEMTSLLLTSASHQLTPHQSPCCDDTLLRKARLLASHNELSRLHINHLRQQ
ncbi:hypothetical protein TNCV_482781 [Trichonephila clavipes]|uniref:Endonuclease/exonuclease/phosphatase domain-containing protein n=1 Tax=Trichonephila clavipes TaxID=2585209 RepID=A0A8X6VBV4_TRICX|nr:hypothetical protein TNCV_482781 [Trichonephila clavipes]